MVYFEEKLRKVKLVKNISYEPELFPGLIYKLLRPNVCILIFGSGKLVLTGARKRSDFDAAL